MNSNSIKFSGFILAVSLFSANSIASGFHAAPHADEAGGKACEGAHPQIPRNMGTNKLLFKIAPPAEKLNLCNVHFHNNAEHKTKDFSIFSGNGDHGHGEGYQYGMNKSLSLAKLKAPQGDICNGLKPGDTIEVHWVHTSCDIKPGKGLGSCVFSKCVNPDLRVETQVFTVVNDAHAQNFNTLTYDGNIVNDLHQAKALPTGTGKPVEFLGSTTGPKFTEQSCSPYQVTWTVRSHCAKVDISSLAKWCEGNAFEKNHAHGVRKLITNPALHSSMD